MLPAEYEISKCRGYDGVSSRSPEGTTDTNPRAVPLSLAAADVPLLSLLILHNAAVRTSKYCT